MHGPQKIEEVRRNYEAFCSHLPELMETHPGKFALLRHTQIEQYFDSPRDALVYAMTRFDDGLYSVQEVTQAAVDLGWYSHAPDHAAL